MADGILKITLPNFNEPNEQGQDCYDVLARINENKVGEYSIHLFDRYDFIEQTSYEHQGFCFFARRLEFHEIPYLNYDGSIIFVLDNLKFDNSFSVNHQIAFLKNSVKKIASKLTEEIADIYAISTEDSVDVYKGAGFEVLDSDEIYGTWMHYIKPRE